METQFSEKESLELISRMISTAKNNLQKGSGNILLIWGYLVLIASVGNYILLKVLEDPHQSYYVWFLMFAGGAGSAYFGIKSRRETLVRSHIDTIIGYSWLAFGIGMIIIIINFSMLNRFNEMQWSILLPVLMMLYGIGLFVMGAAIKFMPIIYGAVFCWICSCAGFYLGQQNQFLVLAVAVLFGYIIPGHLLNAKAGKNV